MIVLLNAVTAVSTGVTTKVHAGAKTVAAKVLGVDDIADVTATVLLEGSNDGTDWFTLHTFSLTSTGAEAKAFHVNNSPFPLQRASVTAIGGTSAAVTVTIGE